MSESGAADPWDIVQSLPMGTSVEIRASDGRVWRGTLVPRHELSGVRIVQLKLESGYNVGVRIAPGDHVEALPPSTAPNGSNGPSSVGPSALPPPPGAEWVALLTTGGTIASRVDYRTGGVRPVKEESEILSFYPDLDREGPVRVIPVLDRLSEEITPHDWVTLAKRVVQVFQEGARGVVIAHGTDTLAYTSAALSFLLTGLPGPVVLVGAQRSPDRPSSDGPTNLGAAVRVARHPELAEVVVLMHAGLSDDRFAIHRGTRVRKMHTSRRDAFQTRNGPPLGLLEGDVLSFHGPLRPRSTEPIASTHQLESRAGLLWFHPGLDAERAEAYTVDLRGVVLAGTGLGHVSSAHLPWIRRAVQSGKIVAMTSQCLEGSVNPYVYATGRELLQAGVVYLRDMLPETAFVKLMWALARSHEPAEASRLMLEDRAGEFEARHITEGPA